MARLFLKAVKLPPHVLFREVVRKLRERYKTGALRKRALAGKLSLSDDAFRRALKGKGSLKGFLRRKREGGEGTLSLHGVREAIEENFGEYKKGVVGYADEVCSHRFDLLGSGPVDLAAFLSARGEEDGSYLPWHWDFKSGYRWERETFYKDIRYGNVEGQDVKVPWELSRFQHLFPLGQAYVLTGDEKYAGEFVREVDDWITCNPSHLGVNWACTMDVGIRAANWLLAWPFFRESKVVTDAFARRFFKSILQHGRFIRGNLEWSEVITSNHYLSNIAGLLSIALLVPELRESRRWREFAVRELVSEMEKQVYDDGMDFEASTCYHRLVLELFFFSALLCRSHGIELPESFLSRLRGMFDVVLRTVKPNGRMPQIGDNDSGRFHIFCDRDSLDATYLLTFGALFFDSPEYRVEGFGFAPEALWLFGADAYERWLSMPPLKMEELGSARLLDGGLYVMRWGGDYMIVSCGLNGQNDLGGHAHNDKLSFELCIDGREVIVDPGTYVYTPYPDERNRFRGTASHNTVMIDGEEQNRFTEGGVFGLHNDTGCRCLHWGED
ncbi:MAG: alginate lyase family protein, partial [Thermodesulfobacteriota bacterium]